jgi:deazaflavin-dependent oxidoreductase (nitroreductase family)
MTSVNDFNRTLIDEFRTNGGNVTGIFENAPLLLLTTTGAKSGESRTSPVVFTRDGDDYVVIASRGGSPNNPAWYHNLVAHPSVTVEVPGETFSARARVTTGDERDRLWRAQADLMPTFDEYQAKTTRQIPVIVLERVSRASRV